VIIRIFFLFLVLTATALFAADIYMSWPIELILSVNSAKSILELDGHRVDIDFVSSVPAPEAYRILYYFTLDSFNIAEIEFIQENTALGGRAILLSYGIRRYINSVLADPLWDDSLGNIRCNYDGIRDYPPDTVEGETVVKFPNFLSGCSYFHHVDTLIAYSPVSYSILSPDSGTARPFIWGREISSCTTYDSFAVTGVLALYGEGELIVLGEISHYIIPSAFNTTNWGDNRQFIRNLFATNDRADSVWLTSTDTTFTIHLTGCEPFVPESTYVSYQVLPDWATYYGYAAEWGFTATESTITINLPERPDWWPDSALISVWRVPDSTRETVLPVIPVCDTFVLPVSTITENPLPGEFSISVRPNPFNSSCRICAPFGSKIEIFDINGRLVYEMPVGARHISPVVWSPEKTIGSGIYLVRIKNGGMIYTKPVVYIK